MKIKQLADWNNSTSPLIIAGPCAAESLEQLLSTAREIKSYDAASIFRAGVWKPRTRPGSFQGIGRQALSWLEEVKKETGLKVSTEVATPKQVEEALEHNIDVLWIGARTTVNPFYVEEIAEAVRGVDIPVMIKNPIHPDLNAWIGSIERFYKVGIDKLVAIHRGFHPLPDSKYRNYPNWNIPLELRNRLPEIPIITDPSHIAGTRDLIQKVSQDAMDLSFDGLMIETHTNPDAALSDKDQQITPKTLSELVETLKLRTENSNKLTANLEDYRNQIDEIDLEVIKLLSKRMDISKQIAEVKKENDLTLFQSKRWTDLLDNRVKFAEQHGLREYFLREFMQVIHSESIATQKKVFNK